MQLTEKEICLKEYNVKENKRIIKDMEERRAWLKIVLDKELEERENAHEILKK